MPSVLDSRTSWIRLAVTLAIAMVGNVGMWAVIVIMPAVEAEFVVSRALVSAPYTATMAGFALGSLVAGRFVDRHGITTVLLAAAAANFVGFFGASRAASIAELSAFQLLLGLGTAVSFGPLIADISHWFLRRRGIAVTVAASGNYLAGAIWPMLLAGRLEAEGWRSVYLFLAIATVTLMVPLAVALRAKLPAEARVAADTVAASNRRDVGFPPRTLMILLCIAGLGCCVAMSMPQAHIVALSVDLGCGPRAGGQMLSLMLLGGVVSRLVSGLLADRIGGVRTLLIGSTLQCLALALYLPATTETELFVVSLLFGLAQGGIVPSYAIIVRDYMPAAEAGARTGYVITATIVGMAFGGWVSGVIYDASGSYTLAFLNSIAWNLLNIGIIATIFLAARRPGPAAA